MLTAILTPFWKSLGIPIIDHVPQEDQFDAPLFIHNILTTITNFSDVNMVAYRRQTFFIYLTKSPMDKSKTIIQRTVSMQI
jgi:hypothetical protein